MLNEVILGGGICSITAATSARPDRSPLWALGAFTHVLLWTKFLDPRKLAGLWTIKDRIRAIMIRVVIYVRAL
jgi:hypothetical protein